MTDKIRFDVAPPFAEIVLDQPAKRNALSQDMWTAIPSLVARAEADQTVKIILIHGGEAGAFASGADISEFESLYASRDDALRSGATIAAALDAVEAAAKPVIAAIEGACVGGGVSLAMAADLRIAGGGANFGVTPGKLGLVYPVGDTRRLLNAIGPAATKDLLFTGRLISADEALRMGLIGRITPPGDALSAAREWALQIAAISQWSVRATKQMIRGLQMGWTNQDTSAESLFLEGFANEDFKEGYRAFLDKRKSDWKIK